MYNGVVNQHLPFLEIDLESTHNSIHKVWLCKKTQTKQTTRTWTFQKRVHLSLSNPPSTVKTALQHWHAPHTLILLPRAQANFCCFQTFALPEPAVAIEDIHPSTQDDYDWSRHQTINLYPSLVLLLSSPSILFSLLSLCPLHFIPLLFCWCAEYDEKVRPQAALTKWHVRVTMQSLFDLGEQLIHVFIHPCFWRM